MRTKSALLVTVAVALGIVPHPVFASTSTASFAVTATVVAGCDVTSALAPLGRSALNPVSWAAKTSVNCSLPVPYQVVSGSFTTGIAAFNSLGAYAADAQPRVSDFLEPREPLFRADEIGLDSDSAEKAFLSISATGPVTAQRCAPYDPGSATIAVTITY